MYFRWGPNRILRIVIPDLDSLSQWTSKQKTNINALPPPRALDPTEFEYDWWMHLVVRNSKPGIEICVRCTEELFRKSSKNACHANKANKYMDALVSIINLRKPGSEKIGWVWILYNPVLTCTWTLSLKWLVGANPRFTHFNQSTSKFGICTKLLTCRCLWTVMKHHQ